MTTPQPAPCFSPLVTSSRTRATITRYHPVSSPPPSSKGNTIVAPVGQQTRFEPEVSSTSTLQRHLLSFQQEMRTTLADVARNVSCLQLQTNSLSRTLASELGARDSRNHSAGPLHFREQPASGVQSVPSPRDSNSKLHARLDDIARLLQSNIDATRNEHADKCPLAGVPKYEDYAMSGVQAAPSPTDQSAGVHARLDELTTFVKSNTDTHRKSHSASVASIQKLVLNIEKMISRNMVDLRTELREIKKHFACNTKDATPLNHK